jgi:hypothetical protein
LSNSPLLYVGTFAAVTIPNIPSIIALTGIFLSNRIIGWRTFVVHTKDTEFIYPISHKCSPSHRLLILQQESYF